MKKLLLILITLIVVIGVGTWVAFTFYGSPFEKNKAEEKMDEQLVNLGIEDEEIADREIEYNKKFGKYEIDIEYKGEENLTYTYLYRSDLDRVLLIEIYDDQIQETVREGEHDSTLNYSV